MSVKINIFSIELENVAFYGHFSHELLMIEESSL